jgi:hypothetical protein
MLWQVPGPPALVPVLSDIPDRLLSEQTNGVKVLKEVNGTGPHGRVGLSHKSCQGEMIEARDVPENVVSVAILGDASDITAARSGPVPRESVAELMKPPTVRANRF